MSVTFKRHSTSENEYKMKEKYKVQATSLMHTERL